MSGGVAAGINRPILNASGIINNYFFLKTEFAAISGGTEAITLYQGALLQIFTLKKGICPKRQPLFRKIKAPILSRT